jgi:heme exporter protein C
MMSRMMLEAPRVCEPRGKAAHNTSRAMPWGWLKPFIASAAVVLPVAVAVGWAPTEATMGHAQRVLYVHVSVAWLALTGYVAVAVCSLLYLRRRNLAWDRWAVSAAEVGWLCSWLTLITGSLWAHAAWGTWWTWDPRLVTSLLLWALFGGYLLLRGSLSDQHARARVAAVVAIAGVLDVPLVVMATRWFRAIHPVAPKLEPSMRVTLLLTVAGLAVFTIWLVLCRRRQLELEDAIGRLSAGLDDDDALQDAR